jgi:hypothetical protein
MVFAFNRQPVRASERSDDGVASWEAVLVGAQAGVPVPPKGERLAFHGEPGLRLRSGQDAVQLREGPRRWEASSWLPFVAASRSDGDVAFLGAVLVGAQAGVPVPPKGKARLAGLGD